MTTNKFKKGDWCFCEFQLQLIEEMEDGRITSVSDGIFSLGGYDLSDRCFPLEIKTKQISDVVAGWSDRIHALKINGLNHPDIKTALVSKWVELCENRNNENNLNSLYKKLDEFGNSICNRVRDLQHENIEGVELFRR